MEREQFIGAKYKNGLYKKRGVVDIGRRPSEGKEVVLGFDIPKDADELRALVKNERFQEGKKRTHNFSFISLLTKK